MKIRVASVLLLFLVGSYSNLAVAARVPAGDPKAVALASQSIAALIGKIAVSDVTLTGTVEWNGKDTGSGVLKALGTEESRIDLTLSGTGLVVRFGTCKRDSLADNPHRLIGPLRPRRPRIARLMRCGSFQR